MATDLSVCAGVEERNNEQHDKTEKNQRLRVQIREMKNAQKKWVKIQ